MMIAISFVIFLALVIAWLAAPNVEPRQVSSPAEPAPLLTSSEATA